jgi:Cys-tRNA(Pro) deacylase
MEESPALTDTRLANVSHDVVRHGPVDSLAAAARARGVEPSALAKTMVVRLDNDQYVFVLVPGDRAIDWPKLRSVLDVNRLSLPDAETAHEVTGYVRGTITPFGSITPWPVYCDERLTSGIVSVGGGAPGVAISISGPDLVEVLDATVADVTKPSRPIDPEQKAATPQ